MYIQPHSMKSSYEPLDFDLLNICLKLVDHLVAVFNHLREHTSSIVIWEQLRRFPTHLIAVIRLAFEHSSECPMEIFYATQNIVECHPHAVHILSFTVFFGPIAVLLPFLLIHELAIVVLFNIGFLAHGLIPGTADTLYDSLRSSLLNTRESLFAYLDSAGATYNKWTTQHTPLIILRVCALLLGSYALYVVRRNGDGWQLEL